VIEDQPSAELPEDPEGKKSLPKVLVQNEQIKALVDESAEQLSSINAGIRQELAHQDSQPILENALNESEAVEVKVQDASEQLSVVNLALKDEIDNRHALEEELATVTEQGRVDLEAALHDPLTGLPNRSLFCDRLEHAIQHAKRYGWVLALMFVDLDDFKIINDTYGHGVGDSVLQIVAARIKESIRGGDEFIILITEVCEETNILQIAEKIINQVAAPLSIQTCKPILNRSMEASFGISTFPQDGADPETLIKSADAAMYKAKRIRSQN
jgi:diguanylate cyclase (GGDEF)-like protein